VPARFLGLAPEYRNTSQQPHLLAEGGGQRAVELGLLHDVQGAHGQGLQGHGGALDGEVAGHHHDGNRLGGHDLLYCGEPVHAGHLGIHGDEIGLELPVEVDGLPAVGGLAHHVDVRGHVQQGGDDLPADHGVVDYQNSDGPLHWVK
jgi:hypothetical protein